MAGNIIGFIRDLQERRSISGGVFIDLKISGDIGNTISSLIKSCLSINVKFLTLVEAAHSSITIRAIQAAREARGASEFPRLLMVPLLSDLDTDDFLEQEVGVLTPTDYIVRRGRMMLHYGCDGLIVSGEAIQTCRREFKDKWIVSPGIRPAGASSDGHKRFTTPTEAIQFGADYLIVGRPILQASEPRTAAAAIIDEIDRALLLRDESQSRAEATSGD